LTAGADVGHRDAMTSGTLHDTGRLIARARWLEERCFEILGGWVVTTSDPEAKLLLARQSHHHAWHAELFGRVLPRANGLDLAADTAVDVPEWVEFLDQLAATTGSVDRVVGVFDLLVPRKLAEYERWRDGSDPVRDAPVLRWLQFVIADESADLTEGRALLAGRPATAPTPAQAALRSALDRAGDLLS